MECGVGQYLWAAGGGVFVTIAVMMLARLIHDRLRPRKVYPWDLVKPGEQIILDKPSRNSLLQPGRYKVESFEKGGGKDNYTVVVSSKNIVGKMYSGDEWRKA